MSAKGERIAIAWKRCKTITRPRAGKATSYTVRRDGKETSIFRDHPEALGNLRQDETSGVIGVGPTYRTRVELPVDYSSQASVHVAPYRLTMGQVYAIARHDQETGTPMALVDQWELPSA